ncbi:hypothetical protein JCM5296_001220 [Sporobolomyces johnsonii]
MPYVLPAPSASPVATITLPSPPRPSPPASAPSSLASSPRVESKRPARHHMRSHSSEPTASTSSFIFVQPASPDDHPGSSPRSYLWSSPSRGDTGAAGAPSSPISIPRQHRRVKMFALTPANDGSGGSASSSPGPSSQDESEQSGRTRRATSPITRHDDATPRSSDPLFHNAYPFGHSPRNSTSSSASSAGDVDDRAHKPVMMVRKKSGELVRPSLKTDGMRRDYSKPRSAPATPVCPKYVHFDTQLEHVKHFLAQQRPAAVSRSGSPVETETEDEPEAFPFPAMATPLAGQVKLQLPNFPTRSRIDEDVFVESLEMSSDGKNIRGVVRVKNLAFEKWVAVRFTLDHWQTVSEVSAEHLETMGPQSDRFSFIIKLQDLLARIEEKVMYIAVRYTVGGREIWDNNSGQNYRVEFKKVLPKASTTSSSFSAAATGLNPPKRSAWSVTNAGQAADRMADLRRELDRLVKEDTFDDDDVDHSISDERAKLGTLRLDTRSFTEGSPYSFSNALKMYSGAEKGPERRTVSQPSGSNKAGSSLTAFFDPVSTSPSRPKAPPLPSSPPKQGPPSTSSLVAGMPATVYDSTAPIVNSHSPSLTSPRPALQPDFGLPSTSSSASRKDYYSPSLYPGSPQLPTSPPLAHDYYGPSGSSYYGQFLPLQDTPSHGIAPPSPFGHGTGSTTPRSRYASYPAGSAGTGLGVIHSSHAPASPLVSPKTTYAPLVPPSFRDAKSSPFASPAESPTASPPRSRSPQLIGPPSDEQLWSPSLSSTDSITTSSSSSRLSEHSATSSLLSSPESDATSVPDSPGGDSVTGGTQSKQRLQRPSNALEFSYFLDRYRFHLNSSTGGSSLGLSALTPTSPDSFDFTVPSMTSSAIPSLSSQSSSALSSAASSPTLSVATPRRTSPLSTSCGSGTITPPRVSPDDCHSTSFASTPIASS